MPSLGVIIEEHSPYTQTEVGKTETDNKKHISDITDEQRDNFEKEIKIGVYKALLTRKLITDGQLHFLIKRLMNNNTCSSKENVI